MSNIILAYWDSEANKDIEVSGAIVMEKQADLQGDLRLNLFAQDEEIGTMFFEFDKQLIGKESFSLQLVFKSFFSPKGLETKLNYFSPDATFTEIVAELIEDILGVNTNMTQSYKAKEEVEEIREKVKNLK